MATTSSGRQWVLIYHGAGAHAPGI
jgi:hypothetical protein